MKKAWVLVPIVIVIFASVAWLYSGPLYVTGKRLPSDASQKVDVRHFLDPCDTPVFDSPQLAFDFLKAHGHYLLDGQRLVTQTGEATNPFPEFWQTASESQEMLDNSGRLDGDCDCRAVWLARALLNSGIDAWVAIGTVQVGGMLYGHAWVMVLDSEGRWHTLETTTTDTIIDDGLPPVYSMAYRFNDVKVVRTVALGAMLSTLPPVPVDKITELQQVLEVWR